MNPLSAVYGQVARLRRHWYEQHPQLQKQLGCPVISIGNLVMGGSGKTPVVAMLAGLLRDAGYAPAILSRGYKRRDTGKSVVVVTDGATVLADVEASGDEPQLLARRLPNVRVVVSANRADAGALARTTLGANVLLLDDGYQHLQVARAVNLLMLSEADTKEGVFPAGRLREPLDAARRADALLVADGSGDPSRLAAQVGVSRVFTVHTAYDALRLVTPYGSVVTQRPRRVIALTAIARPERFVNAVRELGHEVLEQVAFRDHHWFTPADVQRVEQLARDRGAEAIVTTEKDAVRLERVIGGAVPFMFLPIDVRVEPVHTFQSWILDRIGPPGAGW